ncbi:MAG: hypothetical protein ACP5JW_04010 [Candidatus Bathyarchaeia archaeon]
MSTVMEILLKNIAACFMERFNVSAVIINSGFGGAYMNETVEKADCQLCRQEVSIKETHVWSGLRICEDCYFDRAFHVRTCDRWLFILPNKL